MLCCVHCQRSNGNLCHPQRGATWNTTSVCFVPVRPLWSDNGCRFTFNTTVNHQKSVQTNITFVLQFSRKDGCEVQLEIARWTFSQGAASMHNAKHLHHPLCFCAAGEKHHSPTVQNAIHEKTNVHLSVRVNKAVTWRAKRLSFKKGLEWLRVLLFVFFCFSFGRSQSIRNLWNPYKPECMLSSRQKRDKPNSNVLKFNYNHCKFHAGIQWLSGFYINLWSPYQLDCVLSLRHKGGNTK